MSFLAIGYVVVGIVVALIVTRRVSKAEVRRDERLGPAGSSGAGFAGFMAGAFWPVLIGVGLLHLMIRGLEATARW